MKTESGYLIGDILTTRCQSQVRVAEELQPHFRREGTYEPNWLYLRPPTVGSNWE
jgi:hypothetical protein